MERELFVSTGEGIGVFSLSGEERRYAALADAGALHMCEGSVLCAGQGGAVWRLERRTLMPQALYPGGPGVCDLAVSGDGARLFVLCGEADSVLLSDMKSGNAQILARAGCNPQHLALDGNTLAVAGGESGCVHLLSADTLETIANVSMPGPVYSAALRGGMVHALCLTPALSSVLVSVRGSQERRTLPLCGMPGRLLADRGLLLAATQGFLYTLSGDGGRILARREAPGRGAQLARIGNALCLRDLLSERAYVCGMQGHGWQMICPSARALASA